MASLPAQKPEVARKPLYGRRKGRPLRPAQRAALERLLPELELDLGRLPADPKALFGEQADALDLLAALPAGCLDRVFILFPDPWPKTRHHKRRIVARPVLDRLAQLMKPGAELRIATDDPSYREWILERVTDHPWFDWRVAGPDDWRRRSADWPATRYEKKALKAGRKPVYLRLSRRAAAREKA